MGIQNISLRNISYDIFNVFKSKIDEILFLSLDKIIIKENTHNPDKNVSEKMILFFDRKNNSLTLDNSINDKSLMDIKSEESGSESSRRWKREIKDIITKEDVKEKKMKKLMILEEELELLIAKKQKRIKKKIMKKREIYIKYLGEEKNK